MSCIYFNYIIKNILKAICLYCTWHILLSRDMYTHWSKRNIWHFPFAYRHKDRIDFKMHNDIRITSTNDRFIFIDYILYRASLNFSFAYQYTFFSIHFINFIRFVYSVLRIYIVYAIYPIYEEKILKFMELIYFCVEILRRRKKNIILKNNVNIFLYKIKFLLLSKKVKINESTYYS